MKRILLISVILAAMLLSACGSSASPDPYKFETVSGSSKGAQRYVALVSAPDDITDEGLAAALQKEWKNKLWNNHSIMVLVFDNREVPTQWLEMWPQLESLSPNQLAAKQAEIWGSHWIATYWRNKTSGLDQVEIMKGGEKIKVIKF